MNIEIRNCDTSDYQVLDFLVNEAFKLYREIINQKEISDLETIRLKMNLRVLYDCDIRKGDHLYAAYCEDKIVGCAYINKDNFLSDLYVKEEYRNNGIGSKLLERIIKDCEQFGKISLNANPRALSLYKKYSFYEIEKQQHSIKMERGNKSL